jgi:L-asparaginase
MTTQQHARVALFALGGTIAMAPQPQGGVVPALSAADLVAAVPGIADLPVEVRVHDFRRLPGASLGFGDLLALAAEIDRQVRSGVDGVVVTQGTDTIEETAYLLDLVTAGDAPVVVTGAMRAATSAGADGPANLLAALRVAAAPPARDLGCLVVFADEIHAANAVRKAHSTSITAFASRPGPLGYLVEDRVHIALHPTRGPRIPPPNPDRHPHTAVVPAVLGDDGTLLRLVAEQADGLVVAGFGAGHVPATWVPILDQAAQRIPVILASRTGSGPVLARTYGFAGSELDLLARGLISAGSLDPYKARILLHLLLMADADPTDIQKIIASAAATAAQPAPASQ